MHDSISWQWCKSWLEKVGTLFPKQFGCLFFDIAGFALNSASSSLLLRSIMITVSSFVPSDTPSNMNAGWHFCQAPVWGFVSYPDQEWLYKAMLSHSVTSLHYKYLFAALVARRLCTDMRLAEGCQILCVIWADRHRKPLLQTLQVMHKDSLQKHCLIWACVQRSKWWAKGSRIAWIATTHALQAVSTRPWRHYGLPSFSSMSAWSR